MSSGARTGGPCPKCQGAGQVDEFGIGLMVVCDECAGAFEDRKTGDPEHQDHAVWDHPAVIGLDMCHACLGTGRVLNLGGTGEPSGHMIESPCPECSKPR